MMMAKVPGGTAPWASMTRPTVVAVCTHARMSSGDTYREGCFVRRCDVFSDSYSYSFLSRWVATGAVEKHRGA